MVIPVLAIAGSLAKKEYVPHAGHVSGDPPCSPFCLLISVILIVGALTFSPPSASARFWSTCLMNAGIGLLRKVEDMTAQTKKGSRSGTEKSRAARYGILSQN